MSIHQKAVKGFMWSLFQKVGSMSISFAVNIILARLLTPSDFGSIGMILVFVNISAVFIDSGFGSALIQSKKTTQVDYSTVFYWNIIVAVVLYGLLYVCSPYIARFYNIITLASILKVIGLILIINALSIVQITILRKNLEFKTIANCYLLASVVALCTTIILALMNFGVWSLVFFQIVLSLCNTLFIWYSTSWHPTLVWSWNSLKNLFSFGGYLILSYLMVTITKQVQSLFIGKLCSSKILGYYSQAQNLENAPTNIVYSVLTQVGFPLLSSQQNNLISFKNIFLKLFKGIAYLTIPLMSLLIILARPLILLLLSDIWLPVVSFFQLLCLAGTLMPLADISYYAISALGKSKSIFKLSMLYNIISFSTILIGTYWSVYGIIIAVIFNTFMRCVFYCNKVKNLLPMTHKEMFIEPVIIYILNSVLLLLVFFMMSIIGSMSYFKYLALAGMYVLLYLLFTRVFHLSSSLIISKLILNKIKRYKSRKSL